MNETVHFPCVRRHWPFILILALTAVIRFIILFQSQTHVHSDEAIIGLMAKHIGEGRFFPVYMYGQPYNAGAALEAYLAAVVFAVFGVGVVPLKGVIVVLSLTSLLLFYQLVCRLYDRPTAVLAALVLAVMPTLLKWHFQVRGYSFYFISIPILTGLFLSIATAAEPRTGRVALFGLFCGLSVWNLELVLPIVLTLWLMLLIGRKLTVRSAAVGVLGLVVGYAPAIAYNLGHQFSNWEGVFVGKVARTLIGPSDFVAIFRSEMPKFFGHDTTFLYYDQAPLAGWVFYSIAIAAIAAAITPFIIRPSRLLGWFRDGPVSCDYNKDLVLLLLLAACFVPYLGAPIRTANFFLGGCFFIAILVARMVMRAGKHRRVVGGIVMSAIVVCGAAAIIDVGRRNEIETLTLDSNERYRARRFPGTDIEAVLQNLRQRNIAAVWTTISFVYPLLFETGEKLAVSDRIFGWDIVVYPDSIPRRQPQRGEPTAFVIETDSPLRSRLQSHLAARAEPIVTEYGTLTVIEEKDP